MNRTDLINDGWLLIIDEDPGFTRVLQILLEEERRYRILSTEPVDPGELLTALDRAIGAGDE